MVPIVGISITNRQKAKESTEESTDYAHRIRAEDHHDGQRKYNSNMLYDENDPPLHELLFHLGRAREREREMLNVFASRSLWQYCDDTELN